MVDAYYFCVGGSVGHIASIARPVGYRCAATDVPDAIERLILNFQESRGTNENLRTFLARNTNEQIRTILGGESFAAVERDVPAGRIPAGVES
jgi:sulfite reductase (ferredoxin)